MAQGSSAFLHVGEHRVQAGCEALCPPLPSETSGPLPPQPLPHPWSPVFGARPLPGIPSFTDLPLPSSCFAWWEGPRHRPWGRCWEDFQRRRRLS